MLKTIAVKTMFVGALLIPAWLFAATPKPHSDGQFSAVIAEHIFDKVKKNPNWKVAFATGKDGQVVFMNVNPSTNPKNEIGMETHEFDQVIFVVEGRAKSIINGKISTVNTGDMIFIPQGVPHNFINLNTKKSLKIISVYSGNDIPKHAIYKKKSDAPED